MIRIFFGCFAHTLSHSIPLLSSPSASTSPLRLYAAFEQSVYDGLRANAATAADVLRQQALRVRSVYRRACAAPMVSVPGVPASVSAPAEAVTALHATAQVWEAGVGSHGVTLPSVLYVVTFRIRTSRDALVRFQSQKENNCSADPPRHEYLLIARAPPHSDAHICMPRTFTKKPQVTPALSVVIEKVRVG